jgi:DNA-binding IclR family transcriptional regulator
MVKSYDEDVTIQDMLTSFILVENIDSFQKLYLLLCLYERGPGGGTCQELAKRFHYGEPSLMQVIVTDLQAVGLLTRQGERYQLSNDPLLQYYLQCLTTAFADPLTRQKILDQVQHQSSLTRMARTVLAKYESLPPFKMARLAGLAAPLAV